MNLINLLPFITIIGAIVYIKDMLRGKAKPNRVTWLLWSFAPLISAAAAFSNGESWSVLPILLAGLNPLLIVIFSFFVKGAYWKISKLDYFCGALSLIALVLWLITKDPVLAVFFAILSDALAGFPTLIKAWKEPESESPTIFILGIIASLSAYFTANAISFTNLGFQTYLIIINAAILLGIFSKSFKKTLKKAE